MKKMLMMCAAITAVLCARAADPLPPGGPYKETVEGIEWTFMVDANLKASVGTGSDTAIPESTKGVVTIPSTLGGRPVTGIGNNAFSFCTGLTSAEIPSSVTSIGDYVFFCCTELPSVTIPSSVTSIGDYAFDACYKLASVMISEGVTSIGDYAFANCRELPSVTIPEGVTNIGAVAFVCCVKLTSVTIPSSVTSIGEGAFSRCSGLMSFDVDEKNLKYKSENGLLLTKDGRTLVAGVNNWWGVTIPEGVTSIGNYAFDGCDVLTSVTIPEGVASIGSSSFADCDRLTSVTIPPSVTSIGDYAFYSCDVLTSVTIPEGVTNIGEGVFCGCGLTNVDFECAPPEGVENAEINQDASIRYNATYEEEWIPVIAACGWTNATPYYPNPLPDGGPYTETVDGITWTFMVSNGEASVGGGDSALPAVPTSTVDDITIPSALGGCPVTSIGDYAFDDCQWLTSVTIPEGVTSIGERAFDDCTRMTSVTIPESVTSIGNYAFDYCCELTSVTIPEGVTSISDSVFFFCGLTSVTIPSKVTSIGDYAFASCHELPSVTIPEGVTNIGAVAFACCVKLTSVTIPSSVTSIGIQAFSGCDGLTSVTIPARVTSIGAWAFSSCSGLTSVTIPSGVTSIGDCAFTDCGELTIVTIPSSITSIGAGPFSDCNKLTSIYVDANNEFYASQDGVLFDVGKTVLVQYPGGKKGAYAIPSGVASIGKYAFCGCSGLPSITIPEGVTNIGDCAFANCSSLMSVTIPEGVTSIGDYAFVNCLGIDAVDFEGAPPEGVEDAYIKTAATIRYNVEYEDEWLPIIEACGWTNAKPYYPFVPAMPVISPESGTTFDTSLTVSMTCASEGATIHYTKDGTTPTMESSVYTGKFKIYGKTTVKAIAFLDDGAPSEMAIAEYAKGWCATPEIIAQDQFTGSKQRVEIACATEGATVRYTTNGSDPNSHATKYKGPFYVTDTTTVKAYATKADYTNSGIATQVVTKVWGIGDTMGKPDHAFETSGNLGFVRIEDATATLGESMKSGAIDNNQKSILSTQVIGPGTLTFKWKASCEKDDEFEWDHAEFRVNGVLKGRINGITDWIEVSQRINGKGTNTVTWTYIKDDVEAQGEDCVWVADYAWASDYTTTQTTDAPVPYMWLTEKCPDVVDEYESYESEAKKTAANPRFTVEQCYVAGLDPASATNEFTTAIEMIDGVPNITWNPDLETERTYKIWGSTNLVNGGDWEWPTNSLHHFFKVTVEMK